MKKVFCIQNEDKNEKLPTYELPPIEINVLTPFVE